LTARCIIDVEGSGEVDVKVEVEVVEGVVEALSGHSCDVLCILVIVAKSSDTSESFQGWYVSSACSSKG